MFQSAHESVPYDVIVVGGGPAGLSAALLLGRSRRRVLVCDSGRQRNRFSGALHGYLSRDGIPPLDFLEIARRELKPYGVDYRRVTVVEASCLEPTGFEAVLEDGARLRSRKLLLATGVMDRLPPVEGIESFYGRSVFHCPYCDGWEVRDQPLAVYGRGHSGAALASALKQWSPDIVLCTDGGRLLRADRARLEDRGVVVRRERILRLEGENGQIERIHFRSGPPAEVTALFFTTGQVQRSDLPQKLGCRLNIKGTITTDRRQRTTVPGLYVVGDISHDMQLSIVAAAEGAKAAIAINAALMEEEAAQPEQSSLQSVHSS